MDSSSTKKTRSKKRPSVVKNTAVYVTELPEDITTEELIGHFSKCGIIMDEIMTGKPRIKLYYKPDGCQKGDALVVYLREESVTLALNILDESEIRPGNKIRVQEASFNQNQNNTSETHTDQPVVVEEEQEIKRNRVDKETWKKHMRKMQKKLEWYDEEAEAQARESARQSRYSKILVLKNMYRPEELELSECPEEFSSQLEEEIREECEEKLGILDCSVQVIEGRSEKGLCTVKFKNAFEAQMAAKLMNGRLFAGLRVLASIYDGSFQIPKKQNAKKTTKLDKEDGGEEIMRLEEFSKWIENEENEESDTGSEESDNERSKYSDNDNVEDDKETEYEDLSD